ncbi:PEGA domain-containing protein [Aeoliella sp. ICT_H6.2]|uniref:PEGA domain-containing protein n=1 Tax=Aeoliella straminimaris TaxID=2954799 RepID=A0A9X2JKM0_9BACT|nr:PEGA domain-containing protein [Aeoliella straminimaris]MCO6046844.1 PEGA domain-containing protein [Aeoliella straminimaris]
MHTANPCTIRPHLLQPRAAQLLLLCLVLMTSTGCVRRRLTVRSNPPGALVYVDNQMIGTTPCSVDFTYYGTREIRLIKSGYETLTVNQPIPAPWYQVPPLDFVSDNFALHKIRDDRTVSFNLQPQMMLPVEEVIRRGEELRSRTVTGQVMQASGTGAPVVTQPGVPNAGSPFEGAPSMPLAPPGGFTPAPSPAPTEPWP